MSRNTKNRNDKNIRRSALSFAGANGSLDVDHVLQSDPWKDIQKFEKSEAACIQNILNDFDDKITQEKSLKPNHITAKKSPKTSPRPKKSPMKSPIKDTITDLPGTSSSTNNNVVETNGNIVETKTTVDKKKRASTKPRQASKDKETNSQELSRDIDNVKEETQKFFKASIEENVDSSTNQPNNVGSINHTIEEKSLDITNITENNLQTSTPRKQISKITKKTARKGESTVENKQRKIKNSESKSKKDVQAKERKISKKSKKDKQDENNTNMIGENEKMNIKLENDLECNKVNQNTSKNVKKEPCCALPLNQVKKKCKKIKNDTERKNAKSKKCNKSTPNQLRKIKLEKENSENKLQKSAQSNKSPRINDIKNIKCQCKKSSAKYSDNQRCSGTKEYEKMRQHKKSMRAAKAIDDLVNRHITVVKKKMKSIKNNLESNELSDSGSSYTNESSYSSYSSCSTDSSSSYYSDSDSSCTSTCNCSYCCCDDNEYTLSASDSSNSSESSENESNSQTDISNKKKKRIALK